jgi:hypothetical protein
VLVDILSYPRFHDTEGEALIIDKYLRPLPGAEFDAYGNIWVQIGEDPTTLFSAHTDTVHKKTAAPVRYPLVTSDDKMLTVEDGGVLGADCGTGIWLMLNMIESKVPGLYIFHRAEELGRQGSESIASDPELVAKFTGIKHCVAFDRKATSSVITHQLSSRCCSSEFALALAAQLSLDAPAWVEDDTGSYTDSASYMHLIPECTNLSVGYYDQHTTNESQDLPFATWMANRLLVIDWANLPAVRDPSVVEEDLFGDWYAGYGNKFATDADDPSPLRGRRTLFGTAADIPTDLSATQEHSMLASVLKNFPAEVADFLMEQRFMLHEVVEELEATYDCDVAFILDQL